MDAAGSSVTLVSIYKSTRQNITEDSDTEPREYSPLPQIFFSLTSLFNIVFPPNSIALKHSLKKLWICMAAVQNFPT